MTIIDLSNSENQTVTLNVTSEAGFDNTAGFYEINEDGSVFDPETNTNIAPGEDAYTEAALANRTDVEISLPDRVPTEIVTEFEGGNFYGSFIVADGTIEELVDIETEGDPDIFFSVTEANFDGVEHVKEVGENLLGYEDLVNGGDLDFNDIAIEFSGIDFASDASSEPDEELAVEPETEPITPEEEEELEVEVEEPELEEEAEVEEPELEPEPESTPEPITPDPTAGPLGEDSGIEFRLESFAPTRNDLVSSDDGEISSEEVEGEIFLTSTPGGRIDLGTFDITGVSDNSGSITYDFGETNNPITIPNDDFFGYVLSDFSNTIPPIENVSIDSSATTLGIDSSAISFTGNSIDVNLAGLTIDSSSVLELDIEFGDV